MGRSRPALFRVLMLAMVCGPVGLAELILRGYGLGYPILFDTNASYRFAPRPSQQQIRRRGARVTIDSKGLRGTKDWTTPSDGKVMFVGDSVTWGGTYIDDEDTFAAGVCPRIEKATARTFVCGNSGANGYGTDNMAERIRHKGVPDETTLVVTLIAPDTLRGLQDTDGVFLFTSAPRWPLRAIWEATAFLTWRLSQAMRPQKDPRH